MSPREIFSRLPALKCKVAHCEGLISPEPSGQYCSRTGKKSGTLSVSLTMAKALPEAPIRAVRPLRCVIASGDTGR